MFDEMKELNEIFAGWRVVNVEWIDGYYEYRFTLKRHFKTKSIDVCPRDCGFDIK